MTDFLDILAADARATVQTGYYDKDIAGRLSSKSLGNSILNSKKNAVIAEVKGASPSKGTIREEFEPEQVAQEMAKGGAVGISVLTEPKHFNGSLENLKKVRTSLDLPVLMKDIVISPTQLKSASTIGANAVLLIQAIFDRNYGLLDLNEMIEIAHSKNLEVVLETHTLNEFSRAVQTEADIIGINNRDLGTLTINLETTKKILAESTTGGKIIVSESGINNPRDLHFLRKCGAQAFLIGSAIMESKNLEARVREFVNS